MSGSHLIRVFEIPPPDGQHCFGGGKPVTFVEVDWFHDALEALPSVENREALSITRPEGHEFLADFIRGKTYFDARKAYLVLHPSVSFTIGYLGTRSDR